jgi:hypothetical protein
MAIGAEDQVAGEEVSMASDEIGKLRRTDLLLSLEEELDVDGEFPLGGEESLHGEDRDEKVPLVVGRATSIDAILIDEGLEGRMRPLIEGIDGLGVKVAVDERRGRTRCVEPLPVDDRVPAGG